MAAVNEANKNSMPRMGMLCVLYLGEENAITQEAADIVVVSKLKLDALRRLFFPIPISLALASLRINRF